MGPDATRINLEAEVGIEHRTVYSLSNLLKFHVDGKNFTVTYRQFRKRFFHFKLLAALLARFLEEGFET